MFTVLWGDDEHTAAEGAYERLMKSRKWIFLTGAVGIALGLDLISIGSVNEVTKVLMLKGLYLRQVTAAALVYMLVQYILIGYQLARSYQVVLEDRLLRRQEAQLEDVREQVSVLSKSADEWRAVIGHTPLVGALGYGLTSDQRLKRLEDLEHRIKVRENQATRIMRSNVTEMRGFTLAEAGVDLLRILLPIVIGVLALCRLCQAGLYS